jgi:hypothetical protein
MSAMVSRALGGDSWREGLALLVQTVESAPGVCAAGRDYVYGQFVDGRRRPDSVTVWTRAGVAAACALGDIIDVSVLPGQGRNLDPGNAPRDWVFARFANEPAPNSCNLT